MNFTLKTGADLAIRINYTKFLGQSLDILTGTVNFKPNIHIFVGIGFHFTDETANTSMNGYFHGAQDAELSPLPQQDFIFKPSHTAPAAFATSSMVWLKW